MRKTFARRWLAALLSLTLMLSLAPAAFADDPAGGGGQTPSTPPVITVTVTPSDPVTLLVGKTQRLTATVKADDDVVQNPTLTWESSADAVATVSANGTVTAVAKGEATITATYTDADGGTTTSDPCEIKVISAELTGIEAEIAGDGLGPLEFGEMASLSVDVKAVYGSGSDQVSEELTSDALERRVSWTAKVVDGSSVEVLRLSGNGRPAFTVRGIGTGESIIQIVITYKYGTTTTFTETIEPSVTVTDSTEVVITEYGLNEPERYINMRVGETFNVGTAQRTYKELEAYLAVSGRRAEANKISWTQQGDSVKIKDLGNGIVQVTPSKVGKTTLTATCTSYTDSKGTAVDCSKKQTIVCDVATQATDPTDPDNPNPPATDDELPKTITPKVTITVPTDDPHTMDPGSENVNVSVTFTVEGSTEVSNGEIQVSRGGNSAIAVIVEPTQGTRYELPLTWTSSAKNVAQVVAGSQQFRVTADQPGETTLTVTLSDKKGAKAFDTLKVIVKGFSLKANKFELYENGSMELKEAVVPYGGADANELTCWSNDSTIAAYVNGKIEAYKPGTTTFTVSDPKRGFRASFDVTVKADPNATIDYGTLHAQTQKFLSFSDLLSSFRRQAGGKLSHITGVNMASGGGDLYYKYNATTGAGTGVGAENYYHPYRAGGIPYGQRSLEDLTFVPKKGYAGQVTINYTGVSEEGKNYVCQLLVTVDPESGSDAGISLTTPYNTALRLNGDDFNRVCRERLGVKLDHVVFSQPPERQGTLYTDYVGPGNYGKVVPANSKYSLKQLDDIWFVPAPGFSGTVTLYYTAYGTGTNAGSFAGQATITVGREDGVAIGGLTFDTVRGSAVRFDDERFNTYCRQVLREESWYDRQTLSRVRFDALPDPGEGVLYYDYRSSSNTGTRAETGTSYYYGTRNPRLDRLTFVPAADFIGTVKIPFTGWTSDGTSFTGNVEVNVRGGSGHGDILYVCQPGKTVSFRSSDFANLSRDLTGRTISYIVFRDLPGSSDGSLYYNNSRITTTGARYQNSSIGRLSFRASNSFSGAVDIPFEGQSTSGETFSGVVTISTSSSGGSGSSTSWGNIRYTSRDGAAAVFDRYDFDSMSQWYNREDVSSVRFQAPASTWGDLYRNYRSSSNPGTRIASSANIARGGLDQVAFVPAGSYTGTVYIDFTAVSDDGSTFSGTVEIAVERSTWNIPTTVPTRFSDVASNAYYADAVKWAVSNGITSGTSSTTFSPQQTCTVAQILSFLYRANGSPRVTGSNPFTDVRTSDYYYEAALWAHQKGLVSGSAFHPFSPCTRSMVVTYLWKLAGQPAAASPLSYKPYTLSGSYDFGSDNEVSGPNGSRRSNFTLQFDAAVTSRTKITVHYDNSFGYYVDRDYEPPETYDVTLIALRPGSSYTINGGFNWYYANPIDGSDDVGWWDGVPGFLYFRANDGSFRWAMTQMGHETPEYALYEGTLAWFRENGRQSDKRGNNYSTDCGALIQLDGNYYFVTYADSAIAAGLMTGSAGFSDVPASASYAQAVAWATEQKITSGTSKTTFSPNNTCTRGQIVTFLYRAMGW